MVKNRMGAVLFILLVFSAFWIGIGTVSAAAAENITETGVDFLTEPPVQETVYTAGAGTVTYTPAENGKHAVITMENATINGRKKGVAYQGVNKVSSPLLAAGFVDLVLIGENTITVKHSETYGLFFFNGSVTVKDPGSLTIDTTAGAWGALGIKVLNGSAAAEGMGNFTLESGNIVISLHPDDYQVCLSATKNITVNGGSLSTSCGTGAVISAGGDISVSGGKVECRDFSNEGLATYDGNIRISGDHTIVDISSLVEETFNLSAEHREGHDGAGRIEIAGGTVRISSGYAGVFSDCSVIINGGNVTVRGLEQAFMVAPDCSGYPNPEIVAATDFEGTQITDYIPENIDYYRYLQIVSSAVGQFAILYEDGQVFIEASLPTNAIVFFAAYDSAEGLVDLGINEVNLAEGINRIESDDFLFDGKRTIKIMVWSKLENLKPLCAPKQFPVSV